MALNTNNRSNRTDNIYPNNRGNMKTKDNKRDVRTNNRVDLSEAEAFVLQALLLDDTATNNNNKNDKTAAPMMDANVLFSLPFHQEPIRQESSKQPRSGGGGAVRRNSQLLKLWHVFEKGVKPRTLVRHASTLKQRTESQGARSERQKSFAEDDAAAVADETSGGVDFCSVRSDEEVRVDRGELDDDDISSCSSWKEEEGGQEHYDSWEVLRDEYAGDFGFDYKERFALDMEDEHDQDHVFKILGTSADDTAAHPHVLSPPLMDAIMSFLPESLENQNFWLKYSLVRDGSSMNTLKHYCRASSNTILAIETTTGEVFGAFTTSSWRTQLGFFGVGDGSFLWRMRYNRNFPCHSLFEQAQMETEIDVYTYSGLNKLVQHCSAKKIGIGGGNIYQDMEAKGDTSDLDRAPSPVELEQMEEATGFGIVVDEFLARGTTSPCATYRNPSLLHKLAETEVFEVANLEVWTLTPAYTVDSAEKMEMTKYFVDQSTHSVNSSTHSSFSEIAYSPRDSLLVASDLNQQKAFYRRVGENDESEEQRNRWQYANMMGLM